MDTHLQLLHVTLGNKNRLKHFRLGIDDADDTSLIK